MIDEINGSIGGTTFQRNRYGFTIKRKPPSRPNFAPLQFTRKNAMYKVVQEWIGLSSGNKSAWDTWASTNPRPSRLNPSVNLNGFNYFQAFNLLRLLSSSVVLTNPTGTVRTLSLDDIQVRIISGDLIVETDVTISGGSWRDYIFLSRPVRPSHVINPSFTRLVGAGFSNQSNRFTDCTDDYSARFGELPSIGDTVIVKQVIINNSVAQIFDLPVSKVEVTA